jgi:hypothetical protein
MKKQPKGPKRRTDAEIRAILGQEPRNRKGCWERQGGTRSGYGIIGYQGRTRTAHRVAWEVFNGPIPDRLHVCHKCDNRRCCNPEHLFLGTQQQNIDDMFAKGRQSTSEQRATHGNARLSPEDVRAIRALYVAGFSQQAIADFFEIHQTAISKVIRRETWRNLD